MSQDNWFDQLGTGTYLFARVIKMRQGVRATRSKRELFPLPSVWSEFLEKVLSCNSFDEICRLGDFESIALACWSELSVPFLNFLDNKTVGIHVGRPTQGQSDLLRAVEKSVLQILVDDSPLKRGPDDVENDLKKRGLSYEGEEIAKAEALSLVRVTPALPPEGHGGAIDICTWVSGRTLWYLNNPLACIEADTGQILPKLQSKVHIVQGERLALAQLLVSRNICTWTRDCDVLRYRGQRVLNGLFGVEKPALCPSGETTLRCIMNLIPSNSILKTLEGRVQRLPSICQWMNVCIEGSEQVRLSQSDMVSAFYLFSFPLGWSRMLCFNLKFKATEVGIQESYEGEEVYLSCKVLPMGWSSAVGVMQFIAEQVLLRGGLDSERQLTRCALLPDFVTACQSQALEKHQNWWQVYLDNFAGGERVPEGASPISGGDQRLVEELWEQAGILSSAKKSVSCAVAGVELGAFIGGHGQWIGGSPERLQKTIKATWWLLQKGRLNRKRLQIILGRWIFILQYRRPAMSHFEEAWQVIAEKRVSRKVWDGMKWELAMMCFGPLLCHTWLGAPVESSVTCSDASQTGGAVAVSTELTANGSSFVHHLKPEFKAKRIPVVLLSLFNGIGGSCRSYDVAGLKVQNIIVCDIHKPANRVTSRRWPEATIEEDIRKLTRQRLEELLLQCEDFLEIHVWAGFPCVDLSSAKAHRLNLKGKSSSLIYEVLRVLEDLRILCPGVTIHFVVENVASMDISARDAISELLQVKPYRLDPAAQAPLARPRFCWTSMEIFEVPGLTILEREGYYEVSVRGEWPSNRQWLEEGSEECNEGVVYPTCVKAIRRDEPPPMPAGISRTDDRTRSRWRQDNYRYPPYQYKADYLIWDSRLNRCRLLTAREREILMGYGAEHTQVAWSASQAKQNERGFEDERCSLIGDSFSIYSFMIFAAFGGYRWTGEVKIDQMNNRIGLFFRDQYKP